MIKIFVAMFVAMFAYGVATGLLGAGLIALCMVVFTHWGGKVLDKRDAEWARTNPPAVPTTQEVMTREGCEGSDLRTQL